MRPSSARAFARGPASNARPSTAGPRARARAPSRPRRRRRRARPVRDRSCRQRRCAGPRRPARRDLRDLLGERRSRVHAELARDAEERGRCRSRAKGARGVERGRTPRTRARRGRRRRPPARSRAGDAELGGDRALAPGRASRSRRRRPARRAACERRAELPRTAEDRDPSRGEHRLGESATRLAVRHQRLRHERPHGEILHVVGVRLVDDEHVDQVAVARGDVGGSRPPASRRASGRPGP